MIVLMIINKQIDMRNNIRNRYFIILITHGFTNFFDS